MLFPEWVVSARHLSDLTEAYIRFFYWWVLPPNEKVTRDLYPISRKILK